MCCEEFIRNKALRLAWEDELRHWKGDLWFFNKEERRSIEIKHANHTVPTDVIKIQNLPFLLVHLLFILGLGGKNHYAFSLSTYISYIPRRNSRYSFPLFQVRSLCLGLPCSINLLQLYRTISIPPLNS